MENNIREIFEDAWAKAKTLKAQQDLALIDPQRALFMDMLASITNPYSIFAPSGLQYTLSDCGASDEEVAEAHEEYSKIVNFLIELPPTKITLEENAKYKKREDFIIGLHDAAIRNDAEEYFDKYIWSSFQHRVDITDFEFRKWLGNPSEPNNASILTTVEELFEDAWTKAKTLKAEADISICDPKRLLLMDCLNSISVTLPNEFEPMLAKETKKEVKRIFNFLSTDRTTEEMTYQPVDFAAQKKRGENNLQREEFFLSLFGAIIKYDWRNSPQISETLAKVLQSNIQNLDEDFQKWIGNPFEPK